jgi:hypothetical protein
MKKIRSNPIVPSSAPHLMNNSSVPRIRNSRTKYSRCSQPLFDFRLQTYSGAGPLVFIQRTFMHMIVVADSYLAANEGTKEIERRLLVLTPHFEMRENRKYRLVSPSYCLRAPFLPFKQTSGESAIESPEYKLPPSRGCYLISLRMTSTCRLRNNNYSGRLVLELGTSIPLLLYSKLMSSVIASRGSIICSTFPLECCRRTKPRHSPGTRATTTESDSTS